MVYGFSGTRHNLTPAQASAINAILAGIGTGQTIAVGCCPTGLDAAVIHYMQQRAGVHLNQFKAESRAPAALRARTLALVRGCNTLIAFPASPSFVRSGTWLAIFAAASMGIPTYVCLPGTPATTLPTCRGVVGWHTRTATAVPGLSHVWGVSLCQAIINVVQITLL